MNLHIRTAVVVLCLLTSMAVQANAAINTFDSPGDVVLSPTQAAGTWYTDRFAPAGFVSGETAPDGRLGTLKHSINASDANGLRPSGFNSAFYDTQGRKFDLAPGATSLFIDIFVPSSWASLDQSIKSGRIAGLWATGVDGSNAISSYPIIEFNNDRGGVGAGFQIYDSVTSGTFSDVSGFGAYDTWYQIGFTIAGGLQSFFVNGALVGSVSDLDTVELDNVILQGINAGNDVDIYWDNLTSQAVPEPASLVVWSLLAATVTGATWWRRRKSAA